MSADELLSSRVLRTALLLFDFINNEAIPNTGLESNTFWFEFEKSVQKLALINKKLLQTREEIQKKIDDCHISKKGDKFDKDQYKEIDKYCKSKNMKWLASAWDIESLNFLDQYNLPFNKIASEAQGLQERMSALYEDMGHVIGRYYEIDDEEHEPGHEAEGDSIDFFNNI